MVQLGHSIGEFSERTETLKRIPHFPLWQTQYIMAKFCRFQIKFSVLVIIIMIKQTPGEGQDNTIPNRGRVINFYFQHFIENLHPTPPALFQNSDKNAQPNPTSLYPWTKPCMNQCCGLLSPLLTGLCHYTRHWESSDVYCWVYPRTSKEI